MEGLARLEVESSWDGYSRPRMGSETSVDTRNSDYVTNKHIGLARLVSIGSGVKIQPLRAVSGGGDRVKRSLASDDSPSTPGELERVEMAMCRRASMTS